MMFATRGRGRGFVVFWRGRLPPIWRPDARLFVAAPNSGTIVEGCFPSELFRNPPHEAECVEVQSLELHQGRQFFGESCGGLGGTAANVQPH